MPITGVLVCPFPFMAYGAYKLEERRRLNKVLKSSAQHFGTGAPKDQKGMVFGTWDARSRTFKGTPEFQGMQSGPQEMMTPDQAHDLRKAQVGRAEAAREGTYMPPAASFMPQGATYTPQAASFVPQAASYVPQAASFVPQAASYVPQAAPVTFAPVTFAPVAAASVSAATVPAAPVTYVGSPVNATPVFGSPASAQGAAFPVPMSRNNSAVPPSMNMSRNASASFAGSLASQHSPVTMPQTMPAYCEADVYAH